MSSAIQAPVQRTTYTSKLQKAGNQQPTAKQAKPAAEEESLYFRPETADLRQRIRNTQDFMTHKYFNALSYGRIVGHVSNYITKNVDIVNMSSADLRAHVMRGVDDFLDKHSHDPIYSDLRKDNAPNLSSDLFFAPPSKNENTKANSTNSMVTRKITTTARLQWQAVSTPGHNNNCGIFAMFPGKTSQEAQAIRQRFVKEIQIQYGKDQLTEVDYAYMQMNLSNPAEKHMTKKEIFEKYLLGVRSGDLLDPFALQKIAVMHGKDLVILKPNSPSDRGKTLEEIYKLNRIAAPLKDVLFITHSFNHFEAVVSAN